MGWIEQTQILEELNRNLLEIATLLVAQIQQAEVVDKDTLKDILGIIREVRANIKTAHDIQLMAKQLDALELEDESDITDQVLQLSTANGHSIVLDDDDDEGEDAEMYLEKLDEEDDDV
jgi:hypothetical protein